MIFSFFTRTFSAFATLIMNLSISFFYDLYFLGLFAKYFSLLTIFSVVLRIGLEKISVRWLAKDLSFDKKNIYFSNILNIYIVWSTLLLLPFILISSNEYIEFVICLFFYSFNIVLSNIIRSQGYINVSILLSGVLFPLTVVLFTIFLQDYLRENLLIAFMYISIFNFFITCFSFFVLLNLRYLKSTLKYMDKPKFKELFFSMFFTFTVVGYQTLPVTFGSIFLSEEQIGVFQYSVMFSLLFGLLPLVTYSVFEVSFSKSKSNVSKLKSELIKLKNVQFVFLLVVFPFSAVVYYFLLNYDIKISSICTTFLIISQLFNIFSSKYQIYSNMIGDVKISFLCSFFGLSFFSLCFISIVLLDIISIETLSICVFFAYLIKYFSFKKMVPIIVS